MKTNNIKLVCGSAALVLLGALMVQGCSSSDDSSGGTAGSGGATGGKGGASSGTAGQGGATGTAGTTSGTAGKGGATSGTAGTSAGGTSSAGDTGTTEGGSDNGGSPGGDEGGAAGASGGDHPTAAECTTFCNGEETICGFGDPTDNTKSFAYASKADCMTSCAGFALGDDSDSTHMTPVGGDSFACRAYHLYNASLSPGGVSNAPVHCPHTAALSHNKGGSTPAPCSPTN